RHIRCLRRSPPKREGHHKESIGDQKEHSPRSGRRRPTSSLRRSHRKKRPPILFRSTQAWLRGSNRQGETLALPHRCTKQLLDKEQRLTDARRNRGRLYPRRGDEKSHLRLTSHGNV